MEGIPAAELSKPCRGLALHITSKMDSSLLTSNQTEAGEARGLALEVPTMPRAGTHGGSSMVLLVEDIPAAPKPKPKP